MKTSLVRLVTAAAYAAVCTLPSVLAQAPTAPRRTAPAAGAAAHKPVARPITGCVAEPKLSPKIPTLPVSAGCPKAMYTITSSASQLSPLLTPTLKENLEKLDQTFTMAYIDIKVGTGALAQQRMYYTVNYTGYLLDGTKFDSSEGKEPITFPYGAHRVIQGWDTGFEGMHLGGKRRLFVPYQLAYGEPGKPPVIPAKAELVFDVELISQSDKPPTPPTPPAPPAGAPGTTGAAAPTGPAGAPATPATPPAKPPTTPQGAAGQPSPKPATPPVTSTTPATPPSPTGSTAPKPQL